MRCPYFSCWPHYDQGHRNYKGDYSCHHCGTLLTKDEFLISLEELGKELESWRKYVEELKHVATSS